MKRQDYIELVNERLGKSGKFHEEIIAYNIGRAFNQIAFSYFMKNMFSAGFFRKEYTGQIIQKDSITRTLYTVLPTSIIHLNDISNGVLVSKDRGFGSGIYFAPISEIEAEYIAETDVGIVDNVVGYIVKEGRVEFDRDFCSEGDTVTLRLVIPFEAYSDDDDIHVPGGFEQELMSLVTEFMIETPQQKMANDGNPNTI